MVKMVVGLCCFILFPYGNFFLLFSFSSSTTIYSGKSYDYEPLESWAKSPLQPPPC